MSLAAEYPSDLEAFLAGGYGTHSMPYPATEILEVNVLSYLENGWTRVDAVYDIVTDTYHLVHEDQNWPTMTAERHTICFVMIKYN